VEQNPGVRLYYDNSYILDFNDPVVAGVWPIRWLISVELTLADGRIITVAGDAPIEARAVGDAASEDGGNWRE